LARVWRRCSSARIRRISSFFGPLSRRVFA
jgi:hypothetical protein